MMNTHSSFYPVSILLLLLIVSGMPFLFNSPAATVETVVEIAYYAQILSYLDSANTVTARDFDEWNRNTELSVPDYTPLLTSGSIVSGNHRYYPYNIITLRELETGSILVFLSSPSDISAATTDSMPDGQKISIRIYGKDAVLLLAGNTDRDLLSMTYLSIIDD